MDVSERVNFLKQTLNIKKEIIGLRQLNEEPPHIEVYQDKNHICYMMGEVLEEGKTFYTILENHVCLLGCAATGLDPGLTSMDSEERTESDQFHVSGINIFPDEAIQHISEMEAARLFPQFKEVCKAILMGPLLDVSEPEVAVIIANPEQVHMLTRAYCYATGHFIKGYAGMGACRMLFPNAFINKDPSFTVSDRSWRKALKLAPDELTLTVPVDKLHLMLENLEESNTEWSV
jgi:uncharacterized protein (DUF169 family)